MAGLIARYDTFRSHVPLRQTNAFSFIERAGNGRALVMLHGSLGTEYAFFPLFEHLPADLHLVSLRLPDLLVMDDLAERFEAFCQQAGLARVTLIGTSIGGYIAQFLARSPRVEAVIMSCAMASLSHMPIFPDERIAEISAMSAASMQHDLLGPMMARWPSGHSGLDEAHALIRERVVPDNPPQRYMGRARFVSTYRDAPLMQLAPERMLVIDCADDPIIPPAARDELQARYGHASHHRFDWGGHFPYLARERDYSAVVGGFLRQTHT